MCKSLMKRPLGYGGARTSSARGWVKAGTARKENRRGRGDTQRHPAIASLCESLRSPRFEKCADAPQIAALSQGGARHIRETAAAYQLWRKTGSRGDFG